MCLRVCVTAMVKTIGSRGAHPLLKAECCHTISAFVEYMQSIHCSQASEAPIDEFHSERHCATVPVAVCEPKTCCYALPLQVVIHMSTTFVKEMHSS